MRRLKRKVVKIAELLERRRLDESKYEGEILCDFVFSKVRKMQNKNEKLEQELSLMNHERALMRTDRVGSR